jgi:hypothetical protein
VKIVGLSWLSMRSSDDPVWSWLSTLLFSNNKRLIGQLNNYQLLKESLRSNLVAN